MNFTQNNAKPPVTPNKQTGLPGEQKESLSKTKKIVAIFIIVAVLAAGGVAIAVLLDT